MQKCAATPLILLFFSHRAYVDAAPTSRLFRESESTKRRNTSNDLVTIQNSIVRISVDLSAGCSLVEFADVANGVNTINSYDLGRQVQASFYDGPMGYEQCVWNNQAWAWNPIGSGDTYGNPSTVLAVESGTDYIACTILPKQWACNNVDCECTFNLQYTIENNIVYGAVQLNNNRADKTDYGMFSQELPAVYVNGFLYRLFGYAGSAPYTFDALTEWDAGVDGSTPVPGVLGVTECFLMFANADGSFGVGVYNSGKDIIGFDGGFFGDKGTGGSTSYNTGYLSPVGSVDLPKDGPYNYEYALIMGDIDTVRKTVYDLHDRGY